MANTKNTALRKSRIEANRNQRQVEPVQAGANASSPRNISPEKARKAALGTLGKTSKHSSISQP